MQVGISLFGLEATCRVPETLSPSPTRWHLDAMQSSQFTNDVDCGAFVNRMEQLVLARSSITKQPANSKALGYGLVRLALNIDLYCRGFIANIVGR